MANKNIPTLVEPDWLEENLDDPDLRVVDCSVDLTYDIETGEAECSPLRSKWEKSHIPGSIFVDLMVDLSETEDPDYAFQLPDPADFAAEMESVGIGNDTRVVAYDNASNEWAARFWWMLRVFGHDHVGVLNGGWKRWTNEDRPTSSADPTIPDVTFTPEYKPDFVADKEEVLSYISDENADEAHVVCALPPDEYGLIHIPNTKNIPAIGESALVNAKTNTYLSKNEIRSWFNEIGITESDRLVTYCGGGIASTSAALAAYASGIENVAVYNGALEEWRSDSELPLVTAD